jgi:hypothetical protein
MRLQEFVPSDGINTTPQAEAILVSQTQKEAKWRKGK